MSSKKNEKKSLFPNIKDNPNFVDVGEDIPDFDELIKALEKAATSYPYLDEYKILVLPQSTQPIIVVNESEFQKLQEKVLGKVTVLTNY